jgi:hypothetical protein
MVGGVAGVAVLREREPDLEALRRAAEHAKPVTLAGERSLPVLEALGSLLPDGIRRGATVTVDGATGVGATSLALASAVTYAEWRARPDDDFEPDGIDTLAARLLVDAALTEVPDGVELSDSDAAQLLAAFGIAPVGLALTLHVHQDPTFGPVIALTVGGPAAALIDDEAVSITPLTARDGRDLVWSLRTAPVLFADVDTSALEDQLLRVSRMIEDVPEVDRFDLDLATGVATAVLAPWAPRPDLALRRLR